LAPAERELLERAAVMGSVFWLGALLVLVRAERKVPELWVASDSTDVQDIRNLLNELTERDYVLKLPDSTFPGDEEYVFKHNLERERIAKLTSATAAKRYHRSIAEWLEHQSNVRAHEEYMAMLGNHRDRADLPYAAALAYLEAGDIARSRYACAKAAEHYRKGLELLADQDPHRRMAAQHNLGDVLLQLGKTEDALASFRDMLCIAYRQDIRGKGGAAHNRIGRLYREVGSLDEAGRHLGTGLGLFESCGDERGVASSLDDIGKLHWLRGDYPRALDQTRSALQMRRRLGDRRSIALSLNNLGLVLQDSGEFKQAIEAFDQALHIRQEIGDLVGVIITLNNLGTVAQDQRNLEKAYGLFSDALTVAREIGDRNKIALVLTNIGEVSHQMGNAPDAIKYLKQAEELCDELGDKLGLADALRGLGVAYLLQNDINKARDCISKAVDIFAAIRSKVHLGAALRTLGEITAAGGWGPEHSQKAQDYLLRSIAIFEEIGNDIELGRSLRAYAKFLEKAHDLGDPATLAEEAANLNRRADVIIERLKQYSSTAHATPPAE
jgi:tetratricopeptide (TPR) repeat protein